MRIPSFLSGRLATSLLIASALALGISSAACGAEADRETGVGNGKVAERHRVDNPSPSRPFDCPVTSEFVSDAFGLSMRVREVQASGLICAFEDAETGLNVTLGVIERRDTFASLRAAMVDDLKFRSPCLVGGMRNLPDLGPEAFGLFCARSNPVNSLFNLYMPSHGVRVQVVAMWADESVAESEGQRVVDAITGAL